VAAKGSAGKDAAEPAGFAFAGLIARDILKIHELRNCM
jgi:hypothetical protein